jgi:glycosyltransferase involved in cell wall biosynthesis
LRILWLSHWFPYPPDNGARLRTYHLIRQLASRHEVALLAFTEQPPGPDHLKALEPVCRVLEVLPCPNFQPRSLRSLAGYFAPMPRYLVDTYSPAMVRALDHHVATGWPQVIVSSEIGPATGMSRYALEMMGLPRLVEDLELVALRDRWRNAQGVQDRLSWELRWRKTTHYVRRLLRELDGCTVASQEELNCLTWIAGTSNSLAVIPNGVEPALYVGDFGSPEPDTLVFSGSLSFHFNFEAVAFFLAEIYPRIRARRPRVTLRITGRTEGIPLDRLPQQPGVLFTGYVEDIRPVVARSWVSIAPLKRGGGTRLKVLEAMALGTPVVSTSKGVEGIEAESGRDLLIADEPDEFAEAVVSLLENYELRKTLSRNGRGMVMAGYDWESIGRRFEAVLSQVANGRT